MRAFILDASNIKVNWTSSNATGYIVETVYINGSVKDAVSTMENEVVLANLSLMSTYIIRVFTYIDLPSSIGTATLLKYDGEL